MELGNKKWLASVLFTFLVVKSFVTSAQNVARPALNLELFAQELIAQPDNSDLMYEDIYENLLQYYQQPINLNQTTREELESLFILSPAQVNSFFEYRRQNSPLVNLYELQAIPGFDVPTIYKLLPFVDVPDGSLLTQLKPLWLRMRQEQNQYFLVRYDRTMQQKKGYSFADTSSTGRVASRYSGSPDKYLIRYRNSHARDYSVGFTAEKDAGEKLIWDPNTQRYGLDFYSAHVQLYNQGKFKALALGDYQLQFGQGLLLAGGFSVGKGAETITTLRRSNLGIRPYTSVLEAAFFRGAAFTYTWQQWELTTFYSNKKVDGNVQSALDTLEADFGTEESSFSSIQATGFHRTLTEISSKHQVKEQVIGSNLLFRAPNQPFTMGITALRTVYNVAIQPMSRAYNQFEFAGQQLTNLGTHYSYNWQNLNFFGETAYSSSGGWGTVNGLLASLSARLEASVLYRNYSRQFHSLHGNAFGESTRNNNEQGWYFGLKVKPTTPWEITAYYDAFVFPWLKYRVNAPSNGNESLVRLQYRPTKTTLLYVQFRSETKGRNVSLLNQQIDFVSQATRKNYLLYLDYTPSPKINLRSRIQHSTFTLAGKTTQGYFMAQDVSFNLKRWQLSTRYGLFDTDDYDNRQYTIERDVLYAFSVPALSGVGAHYYLVAQFKANSNLDFWVKYSNTNYRHQATIGSGLEEMKGHIREDIRVQVRYGFN
ncbi:ComEA family DNA-binding protein [Adhaeribacter radiodurans]|uniref:Helix-hairpin-helix domain-containing protein n=1 Tax=Adhaeribacter radiodurans TaxID=2745197 RepID=A0A7L7L3A0_9BACT|nr:helix-hairpin-helix domain-containing protein [Adhaeribacter radiodurans]QMU27277.1 helix-hairpin-helix domain-containing protein [Adhaeribacter radiodurans]